MAPLVFAAGRKEITDKTPQKQQQPIRKPDNILQMTSLANTVPTVDLTLTPFKRSPEHDDATGPGEKRNIPIAEPGRFGVPTTCPKWPNLA